MKGNILRIRQSGFFMSFEYFHAFFVVDDAC